MRAIVHTYCTRPDGSRDSFCAVPCKVKDAPQWWHLNGLSYTAAGYGSRIPSRCMVLFNGRWHRVYIAQFSNAGSAYIGRSLREGFLVHFEG